MRADTEDPLSGQASSGQASSEQAPSDRSYPRPRSEHVRAYEHRMQAVDPDYRLPLVDFWDPALAGQLENLRREGRGWICGDLGDLTVRYRTSHLRDVDVDLEVLERTSGRRLRQDGSASTELFNRLDAICF